MAFKPISDVMRVPTRKFPLLTNCLGVFSTPVVYVLDKRTLPQEFDIVRNPETTTIAGK